MDVGVQTISSNMSLPAIGAKSSEFAGFGLEETYRPLILSTIDNCLDPDSWQVSKLSKDKILKTTAILRKEMKNRQAKIKSEGDSEGLGEDFQPYDIKDSEVKLLKAYTSKDGRHFVQIIANEEGPLEAFFFLANDKIKYIGPSFTLVDAGDYDSDGKSEVILKKQHYDNDGYLLFCGDFLKPVEFDWSYH